MIIEKIDIKSFGALTNTTLEFTETVNVIEGQNESGKTTIAAFIRYMLYGFGADDGSELSERKKRINWTTGTAQGSMIVRVKGKRYLINRTTVPTTDATGREIYKEDSSIIDLDTGTTSFGKLPSGEVFFEVSKELFENTAFVGQIGDSSINRGSVKESIENILFSANEKMNTARAASRIKEKMEELYHTSGGGVIPELERRRDDLLIQLNRSDEDNKKILSTETELHRIREERREAEEKLERLYDFDNCYKNIMLIQTFDQLHVLEEESAAKAEAYNSFIAENTHAGYTPTESYLTDLTTARRAAEDARRALAEAEEVYRRERGAAGITKEIEGAIELSDTYGGEDAVISLATAEKRGFIKNIFLTIVSAIGLIAAGVYEIVASGAFADLLPRIAVGVLGVATLAGVVAFALLIARYNKGAKELFETFGVENYQDLLGKVGVIKEARAKRDGMIRSIECARLNEERCRQECDERNTELTRVIIRWGEEPPRDGKTRDEFLDALAHKVSAFLERRNILFEDKNNIELTVRELRRTLSDKNEIDIRASVAPMRRKTLPNYNHDQITKGIADLKERIHECEREAFAVESELISLRARAGDPGVYKVKLYEIETKIDELKARYDSYQVALMAIESGTENLRSRVSPRLGEYATEIMSSMTDKRYSGFSVSDGLAVTYITEDGEKRSVDFLSGGTRDLAYVALRVALVDMLYEDKPPICFDETFAHQDNVRAQAMMRALAKLAEDGYQSFVFTCRNREAALASELVTSPGLFKIGEV